jgi:hypothetical protein
MRLAHLKLQLPSLYADSGPFQLTAAHLAMALHASAHASADASFCEPMSLPGKSVSGSTVHAPAAEQLLSRNQGTLRMAWSGSVSSKLDLEKNLRKRLSLLWRQARQANIVILKTR